jgi:hypothetical protein
MKKKLKTKNGSLLEQLIVKDKHSLVHQNMDTSSFHQTAFYFLSSLGKPICKILKPLNEQNENP